MPHQLLAMFASPYRLYRIYTRRRWCVAERPRPSFYDTRVCRPLEFSDIFPPRR